MSGLRFGNHLFHFWQFPKVVIITQQGTSNLQHARIVAEINIVRLTHELQEFVVHLLIDCTEMQRQPEVSGIIESQCFGEDR